MPKRMFKLVDTYLLGKPVAELSAWSLRDLGTTRGKWGNFTVVSTALEKQPKRVFRIGWNGERLLLCRDAGLLEEHYPTVMAWVVESLRKHRPRGFVR